MHNKQEIFNIMSIGHMYKHTHTLDIHADLKKKQLRENIEWRTLSVTSNIHLTVLHSTAQYV